MKRPAITTDLLATLSEGVPSRLVRKLDKSPTLAEQWTWEAAAGRTCIRTETGETVELSGEVLKQSEDVRCSCLLAPRCLHVLAVLSRLELADVPLAAELPLPTDPSLDQPATQAVLTPAHQRATSAIFEAGTRLLVHGAAASGAMAQAALARATHEARALGLHSAAAAGLRAISGVRALRERRPEFSLAGYAQDLLELLSLSGALNEAACTKGSFDPSLVGTARRHYEPIGHLRLFGICSEPIIAASGYAGACTTLYDGRHSLYTVVDVAPSELQQVRAGYEKGVRLGETTISQRELGRAGLFVQDATASRDGRLGAGKGVKAASASGCAWSDAPLNALWQQPLARQLERFYQQLELPSLSRAGGWDLLFLDGEIVGVERDALLLAPAQGGTLRAVAASEHAALHYGDNLALLGRATGLQARFVCRLLPDRPRTVAPLALGSLEPKPEGQPATLRWPEGWATRCNLGFDRLEPVHFSQLAERPQELVLEEELAIDPLAALRRRLERLALGGTATLPPEADAALEAEARLLERQMMPGAARLLRALLRSNLDRRQQVDGRRASAEGAAIAHSFVAAASYARAAERELQRQRWIADCAP